MRFLLSIILLLIFSVNAYSQQHRYNWKVGLHGGIATYYGDLSHSFFDVHHKFKKPFQNLDFIGYGLSLEYHLSKTFGLKLQLLKSQLVANDRTYPQHDNYNRALNVQTDIVDATLLGVFYFDNGKLLSSRAVIAPYLMLGGGLTYFDPRGDLKSANDGFYYYWSDQTIRDIAEGSPNANNAVIINQDGTYETPLRPLNTEGVSYGPITWNVSAGLGFKFRLSRRFHLHLEGVLRYTGSDYLDDVSGDYLTAYNDNFQAYAANPSNQNQQQRGTHPKMNDWYAFLGLSLHYSFGQKTYPIRPAIIYTPSLAYSRDSLSQTNSSEASTSKKDTSKIATPPILDGNLSEIDTSSLTKDTIAVNTSKKTTVPNQVVPSSLDTTKWIKAIHQKDMEHLKSIHKLEKELQQSKHNNELLKKEMDYELKIQSLKNKILLDSVRQTTSPSSSYKENLPKEENIAAADNNKEEEEVEEVVEEKVEKVTVDANKQSTTVIIDSTYNESKILEQQEALISSIQAALAANQPNKQNDSTLLLLKDISKQLSNIQSTPTPPPTTAVPFDTSRLDQLKVQLAQLNATNQRQQKTIDSLYQLQTQKLLADSSDIEQMIQKNKSLQSKIKQLAQEDTMTSRSVEETLLQKKLNQSLTAQQNLLLQTEQQKQTIRKRQRQIDSLRGVVQMLQQEETPKTDTVVREKVVQADRSKPTHLTKIYFPNGQSTLSLQAKETLATMLGHLTDWKKVRFVVKGFASQSGDANYNRLLSQRRATIVAQFLNQSGIEKSLIEIVPQGEIESKNTAEELLRRAEVHLFLEED